MSVCDVVMSRYCLRDHAAGKERKEGKDVLGGR